MIKNPVNPYHPVSLPIELSESVKFNFSPRKKIRNIS